MTQTCCFKDHKEILRIIYHVQKPVLHVRTSAWRVTSSLKIFRKFRNPLKPPQRSVRTVQSDIACHHLWGKGGSSGAEGGSGNSGLAATRGARLARLLTTAGRPRYLEICEDQSALFFPKRYAALIEPHVRSSAPKSGWLRQFRGEKKRVRNSRG